MERASYTPGEPSWIDLGSPDMDGAAAFYGGLFGWEASEAGPVEETGGYRMFLYKDRAVAGLGPQQSPGPPWWTTYVTVADVDATVAAADKAGATVLMPPMDVLTAGRMAVFADPTGAALSVWQPVEHPGAGLVNEANTFCWAELSTRDTAAATAFYTEVFGWGAKEAEGYTEWQVDGRSVAGMMQTPDMVPADVPPHWLVYVAVDDADAALARAQELGGSVLAGPMDIQPGRFGVISDPSGAVLAVIALNPELIG